MIRHQTDGVTKWVLVVVFLTRPQIRELKRTHVCMVNVCVSVRTEGEVSPSVDSGPREMAPS